MGIRGLNRYITNNCKRSVKKMDLFMLRNKIIVIDASIYMYRYKSEGNMIEGIFMLNSLFIRNEIKPVYIFDGKTPHLKMNLINKRNTDRKKAKKDYDILKNEQLNSGVSNNDYKKIRKLKREMIRITNQDYVDIKTLLTYQNIPFIDAIGEADALCSNLVKDGKAYACLTDDSDMFAYGCPRVLRYLSMLGETLLMYDYNKILNELELTDDIFKIICAMSTNDYSIDNMNLYKCIDTYKNYLDSNDSERFIDYLLKDGKYIKDVDKFQEIINIYNLREVDIDNDNIELDTLFNKNKENGDDIKDLLEKHNFVFVM